MTALPDGVRSVVTVERHGNVIYLDFLSGPDSPGAGQENNPWWSAAVGDGVRAVPREEAPPATRSLPARWSPRPLHVLGDRFARSQFVADLRQRALLIGFCLAFLAFYGLVDLALLFSPTLGGPR